MRRVTAKPPNMLMAVSASAKTARPRIRVLGRSVTPALHTPLMSVTNAISSVIVVGALLAVGTHLAVDANWVSKVFGFIALVFASVNIFGGFLVTQRMLAMYKKKG